MPETKPMPALDRLRCYDTAAATLREENERIYPGPTPAHVDPAKWAELVDAVYCGQFAIGLNLRLSHVRDLAAIIADRVLVTDPREAVSAR
jgi:hypothetical protein